MWRLAGRLVLPCLMLSVAMVNVGWAQGLTSPTADEIVARMVVKNAERQAALEHYVSERTYRVEYKGTGGEHFGEMRVHAEYSAPGQKRFTVVSESGSKLICEKVLRRLVEGEQEATEESNLRQTMLSAGNYNVELVGTEQIDGIRAWVLKVSPKVSTKFTYRGKVWVSEDDFAVMRVHGEPAKNPSWWINRTSFDSRFVRRGEF
jgi:hypothetical protein